MTKSEHRKAYEEHRNLATTLMADVQILFATGPREPGVESRKKAALAVAKAMHEYHEELCCMAYHFGKAVEEP